MRVCVTGGCGFIGSHLADRLVAEGHEVTILDNLSSGKRTNAPDEAECIEGDVTDAAIVHPLAKKVDAIVHLAAIASIEQCRRDWRAAHHTNIGGTVTVFEAAAKAGGIPVVYASSAAVYGDNPNLPLTETAETRPLSAYGVDKLSSELHGRIAWSHYGVATTGLRFFNVYGPRQDAASPYSGVISKFVSFAKAKKPFTFFGEGTQTRDFIYVGDVVDLILRALKAKTNCEVFNGCSGNAISIKALAATIANLAGIEPRSEHLPPRDGDIEHSLGSPLKASTILGFTASTPLDKGLATLMEPAHA